MTSTLEVDLHKATEKTSWLIDTEALTIQEEIGKGRFGTVYKGTMLGSTVAVKALFGPSLDTEVTGSRSGECILCIYICAPFYKLFYIFQGASHSIAK